MSFTLNTGAVFFAIFKTYGMKKIREKKSDDFGKMKNANFNDIPDEDSKRFAM